MATRSGRSEERIAEPSKLPLSNRERREAVWFYAATAAATLGWWALMWLVPSTRSLFLGTKFAQEWLWVLLGPDALTALVGGALLAVLVARRHPLSSALAWVHFGAQGYAWTISLGLACFDPSAYVGLVSMTFATGLALAFAVRIQETDVLWGPFQFRFADEASSSRFCRQSIAQTVAMWAIFLGVFPLGIHWVEGKLGWSVGWTPGPVEWTFAATVFTLCAIMGFISGWNMTRFGEGTPLPSACARKLVTSGPYRFVRNPMAIGGVTQGVVVGVALGSPLVIVYAVIGGVWWELLARGSEERFLVATFGAEYEAYRDRVRCWLPFPKR